jgi:hypothetical protein
MPPPSAGLFVTIPLANIRLVAVKLPLGATVNNLTALFPLMATDSLCASKITWFVMLIVWERVNVPLQLMLTKPPRAMAPRRASSVHTCTVLVINTNTTTELVALP